MRQTIALAVVGCAMLFATSRALADTTVLVDPSQSWQGFMNVSELPENGGAPVFASGWGFNDLVAVFSGNTLTLTPNTIGDPDPFWYVGGGGPGAQGNKNMEANGYVEVTGPLSGQEVTFAGTVLSNTLVDPYTSIAFIRDFAPDYSSFNEVTVPMSPGAFSISLNTLADPLRHVQYGFQTVGPNVWVTDVEAKGSVVIAAVPEPATIALVALAGVAILGLSRRRIVG